MRLRNLLTFYEDVGFFQEHLSSESMNRMAGSSRILDGWKGGKSDPIARITLNVTDIYSDGVVDVSATGVEFTIGIAYPCREVDSW